MRRESLDVFDTVLTRRVLRPTDAFLLLGREIACDNVLGLSILEFCRLRTTAESESRRPDLNSETTLVRIYETLVKIANLSPTHVPGLVTAELDLESRLLCLLPGAFDLVKQRRQFSPSLLFLSDMYLPQYFIQGQLERFGLFQNGDELFVSNEVGASKHSGSMFDLVLRTRGITPDKLRHTGNDESTDVRVPRQRGIEVDHLPFPPQDTIELDFSPIVETTAGVGSIVGAAARLARLHFTQTEALGRMGAAVAAPALVAYILWVLGDAKRRNIKRLYFLSRDGEIMLQIARRLDIDNRHGIDFRYLHGSRKSWHLPSLKRFGARELGWLLLEDPIVDLEIFCGRLGITTQCGAEALEVILRRETMLESPWTKETIYTLKNALPRVSLSSPLFSAANQQRDVTLEYFTQEGLFEPVEWAFVDLGWTGSMLVSFSRLIEQQAQSRSIRAYFFGQVATDPFRPATVTTHSFYFVPGDPLHEAGCKLQEILEIFCSSAEAMTTGYQRKDNGMISPLFRSQSSWINSTWKRDLFRSGVWRFMDYYQVPDLEAWTTQLVSLDIAPLWKRALLAPIVRLFEQPEVEEAAAIGCFQFSSDSTEAHYRELAPGLKWKQLILAQSGTHEQRRAVTFWLAGSVKRSSWFVRFLQCRIPSRVLRAAGNFPFRRQERLSGRFPLS